MSFPPPPVNTIDWSNVGFKVREVNGHIECHYSVSTGSWSRPKFITSPFLQLHGMSPALNYGQQAYEGIKAFRSPSNTINIFRPTNNAKRLAQSAEFVSIPPVPEPLFLECVEAAVSLNAAYVPPHETGAAMYIRPIVFGSSAQLGLNPPEEYTFCVFVMPTGVYHGVHAVKALILEDFDRSAPWGTGAVKIGGNYAPVLRHSEMARQAGYGITLHLDSKTRSEIDEFSTSGFIGIKADGDNITMVAPESRNIIASVTSASCLDIAKSFGWKTEVRPVRYEELPTFSEIMAAGTAAALVPIQSITRLSDNKTSTYGPAGSDEPGPLCLKVLNHLKGIQQGKIKDTFNWNWNVPEVDLKRFAAVEQTNGVNGDSIDKLP